MGLLMTTMRRTPGGVQTSHALGALESWSDWGALADDAGSRYGVDPAVILSVIRVESGGDPDAEGAAGEIGLMQLMPSTAAWLRPGVTTNELRDPAVNVDLGARYLARQLARYDDDLPSALSAYNAGTATPRNAGYVSRVLAAMTDVGASAWGEMTDGQAGDAGQRPWLWIGLLAAAAWLVWRRA